MTAETEARRWTGWRTVNHFSYVERDFSQVRSYLCGRAARRLLGDSAATGEPAGRLTDLHVHRAGVDLSRDVRVILGDMEVTADAVRVPLHWEDARRPGLFPVLAATLEIVPLASGRHRTTQLGLLGRYEPPFGRLGALADTVAGSRVVFESIERFLDNLVERLERDLPQPPPAPEEAGVSPARPPERLRRVFLPVDGLGDRAGGALEIQRRLQALAGVVAVQVDPLTKMAVVEYDATACGLTELLTELDEVLNDGEEEA